MPELTGDRPYRGARKPASRARIGIMSDNREAWVSTKGLDIVLFAGDTEEWLEWKANKGDAKPPYPEGLPPVRIELRYPGRRPTTVNLTGMTVAELEKFRDFFQYAVDRAMPICSRLDQLAEEAFQRGDDSYARLYRPVPVFIVRKRHEQEHDQGVPSGPDGAAGGDGPASD